MLNAGRPWGTVALFVIITGAWVIDILSCRGWIIPEVAHGLADVGTASVTMITGVWLVVRHYAPPSPPAGSRVVTDAEFFEMEAAITRAVMASRSEDGSPGAQPRPLREALRRVL